jgi:thiamine-phosphate pyrophosphorylase
MAFMIKSYFISSSKHFKAMQDILENHHIDYIVFRDKECEDYAKKAEEFLKKLAKFDGKIILHQEYKLAKKLGVYGVHLTSNQLEDIKKAKELGLYTIISTHSLDEAKKAQILGADAITFSPIFHSPNKGEPKGVDELKKVVAECDIKVFALGGIISKEHIRAVEEAGAYGFASIRLFATSTPLEKAH